MFRRTLILAGAVALSGLALAAPASARDVGWSVSIAGPGYAISAGEPAYGSRYYAPSRVYPAPAYYPPPVYYPAPTYYSAPIVYPAPAYVVPPVVYRPYARVYYGRGYHAGPRGHSRGHDGHRRSR